MGSSGLFYGYRLIAAGSVAQMMTLGCVYTYGVIFSEIENEFGWSRATISGAASLFFLLYGSFGIIAGRATDRFGPRIVLTICGFLFGLGFLLLSEMTSTVELYLYYGVMCGIGMAAHDVSILSTIARWFVKYRGMASGIVKAGAGIGQMVLPLIAAPLIASLGWQDTCLIIGSLTLVLLAVTAQVFRRAHEDLGLKPLTDEKREKKTISVSKDNVALSDILSDKQFWFLSLSNITLNLVFR